VLVVPQLILLHGTLRLGLGLGLLVLGPVLGPELELELGLLVLELELELELGRMWEGRALHCFELLVVLRETKMVARRKSTTWTGLKMVLMAKMAVLQHSPLHRLSNRLHLFLLLEPV
jgi:hypothetical protein